MPVQCNERAVRVNKLYHCSYSLSYHFVFVTKYRRRCQYIEQQATPL